VIETIRQGLAKVRKGIDDYHKIVYGADKAIGAYYTLISIFTIGPDVYVQEHSHYGDPSDLAKVEEELKSIKDRISPRTTDARPDKLGTCIDGAFVIDAGMSHYERTTLGIRLKEFGDAHFALEMILKDRLVDSDALEPRLLEGEEAAKQQGHAEWYSRIKFFRKGKRVVSSWTGFEALAKRPSQGAIPALHEFSFVSQGEPGNPMLPVLTVDLYTGVKGNTFGAGAPSLYDEEVVELWDRLTGSIRPLSQEVHTKRNSTP